MSNFSEIYRNLIIYY